MGGLLQLAGEALQRALDLAPVLEIGFRVARIGREAGYLAGDLPGWCGGRSSLPPEPRLGLNRTFASPAAELVIYIPGPICPNLHGFLDFAGVSHAGEAGALWKWLYVGAKRALRVLNRVDKQASVRSTCGHEGLTLVQDPARDLDRQQRSQLTPSGIASEHLSNASEVHWLKTC